MPLLKSETRGLNPDTGRSSYNGDSHVSCFGVSGLTMFRRTLAAALGFPWVRLEHRLNRDILRFLG